MMGDAADDVRDAEEELKIEKWLHANKRCDKSTCPYCYWEYFGEEIDENIFMQSQGA